MKTRSTRTTSIRATVAVAASMVVGAAVLVPGLAGADVATSPPVPTKVDTVYIKDGKAGLRFVAPATVDQGDQLQVLNTTNPKQVGPHTFSLVTKSLIPKTKKARQLCFTKGHICKSIAAWHGVKGNGPPTINPVEVGAEGWDTMGSLTAKGDSWFTGPKPSASIVQQVSAAAGTTITFMCAIHPWMHGSIAVLPAGS